MLGMFSLFSVVFASLPLACLGGCGRRLACSCGCLDCLAGVGSVRVRGPAHGGACCVGAWPPRWWGVLCLFVARTMVGPAALFCGPPQDGACCVAAWPPSWWGVLCWCLSAAVEVRGVVALSGPAAGRRRWVRVGGVLAGAMNSLF